MPDFICKKCNTEYRDVKKKPQCSNKPGCANGMFVTPLLAAAPVAPVVAAPLVPPPSYAHDGGAVRAGFSSKSSHKPSGPVYVHNGGEYAIAPDGSTHSGGNACWKGFKRTAQGWVYAGSYDANLRKADRGGAAIENQLPL